VIRFEPLPLTGLTQRIVRGSAVLAGYMTVQIFAQGFGVLAGFIIVRALDKSNYAFYTLTNTIIATFAMLCDGGIIDAATAVGGRAWQDSGHMGAVLASARNVRRWLVKWTIVPAGLVLAWMLVHNGAGKFDVIVLLLCAWIAAHHQINGEILRVALRLQGRVRQIQNLDLLNAILRLALCLALFAVARADIAIMITAVTMATVFFATRRTVGQTIDLAAPADPEAEERIWFVVRRQWPSAIAFIFQGQIVFLLLSLLGKQGAIADFGALGRIASAFSILGAALSAIVLPRYARCQDKSVLRVLYPIILLGYGVVAMTPVAVALLFPKALLWILGAQYAGLDHELFLVTLNSSMISLGFLAWGLNSVRAWIIPPWINIFIMYGTQLALMAIVGIDTMDKVLWIGILWAIGSIVSSIVATFVFSKNFTRV
jgi:hypothetical protein